MRRWAHPQTGPIVPYNSRPMSLLDELRSDAVALVDSQLPTSEELRSLVGALVSRLERVETHVFPDGAPQVDHAAEQRAAQRTQAEAELRAAQERLAALDADAGLASPPPAAS